MEKFICILLFGVILMLLIVFYELYNIKSSIDRANEYNIRKQNHLIDAINKCRTKVSFDKR